MITRSTRQPTNDERRSAWAERYYLTQGVEMTSSFLRIKQMEQRRFSNARARVELACSTAGVNNAQAAAIITSFERGWKVAGGSVAAQRNHTQDCCDLAQRTGQENKRSK